MLPVVAQPVRPPPRALPAWPAIPPAIRALAARVVPYAGVPARLAGFEGVPAMLLGTGTMGGSVYRVCPRNAPTEAIKVYHRRGPAAAEHDWLALCLLDVLLPRVAREQPLCAVRPLRWLSEDTMALEDTQGETLEAFGAKLADADMRVFHAHVLETLRAVQQQVRAQEHVVLDGTTFTLFDAPLFDHGGPRTLPTLEMTLRSADDEVRFKLKPDNALFTPGATIVVHDPR